MSRGHIELVWVQSALGVWTTNSVVFPAGVWHACKPKGSPSWAICWNGRRCIKESGKAINLSGLHESKTWAEEFEKDALKKQLAGGVPLPPVTADPHAPTVREPEAE